VLLKYLGSLLWGEARRIIKTLLKIVTYKGIFDSLSQVDVGVSWWKLQD